MPFQVNRANVRLIHEKDHLAASLCQGGPAAFSDSLAESTVMPEHLIWRDHFVFGEDQTNLRIERVEGGRGVRLGLRPRQIRARHSFFRLDQNKNGDVLRMGFGPGANDPQACDKRLTVAHKIDVLNVHDLDPGLHQDAVRIRIWVGGQPGLRNHCLTQRMGKAASLAVGENVQFDLPDSVVQLSSQIGVRVLQGRVCLRILLLHDLGDPRQQSSMVAVMGANHLNLIDPN